MGSKCINAGNTFHRCSEFCYRKISADAISNRVSYNVDEFPPLQRNNSNVRKEKSAAQSSAPLRVAKAGRDAWSSLFSIGRSIQQDSKCSYFPPREIPSGKAVPWIPKEAVTANVAKWERTLAGYVVGDKPFYSHLRACVHRLWRPKGNLQVHSRENGFFFFVFELEEDCSRVLQGGPWMFDKRVIVLRRWTPELTMDRDLLSSIPVWQQVSHDETNGERWTKDGSVDRFGRPARTDKSGGWPSGLLLLANQGLCTLAFVGVEVNLVLFCTRVLQQANADASNTFSRWMGTVNLFSLLGAFLSDAYLGRYWSCAIFQSILTTGLVMLPLTTSYLLLEPAGCGTTEQQCDPHSTFKLAMFYLSIYIVAFGKGAGEPSIATFGTDQFDEEHAHEKSAGDFFYSYFYVATNIGTLFSDTVLAYLQSRGHWALGFWISAGSAVLALVVFFSGTSRYRHFANGGNPIARFSQVIVAAWKKSSVGAPEQEDGLYEEHGEDGSAHAGRRIFQTKGFNFLDRAAIITSPLLGRSQRSAGHNPWRLCTVTQVEEAKCVFRLLPIWICTVTFSGIFVQMLSLFVEQGASMRTAVSGFHIPPASMTLFDITCSTVFIVFYKRFISPLYTRITKTVPKGPSDLRKMGYGLIFAMASMITAGFVEIQRKRYAMVGSDGQLSSLFILWQIPQYVLLGTGEACVHVSGLDFFGSQVPDVMRSLGIGLCLSSISVGTYFCSLILTMVMKVTTEGGRPGWIPPNLNDGLMERYFFLMTAVAAVGLALFAWFARRYESISLERSEEASESAVP